MLFILLAIGILIIGAVVLYGQTESGRLKSFARRNKAVFEEERPSLLAADSEAKLDFFKDDSLIFRHVFTFADSLYYLRLCEVKPTGYPLAVTVGAVDFKRHQFPVIKIMPKGKTHTGFALQKIEFPDLKEYDIFVSTPENTSLLTESVKGALRSRPGTYLEINGYGLVYHEHAPVALKDYPLFLLRLKGVVESLTENNQVLLPSKTAQPLPPEDAEMKAMALLSGLKSGGAAAPTHLTNFQITRIVILLVLLILTPFVIWVALKTFAR